MKLFLLSTLALFQLGAGVSLKGADRHLAATRSDACASQNRGNAYKPAQGSGIIVNGNTDDWDVSADFLQDMREAGNPTKNHLSTAYARYDCVNAQLCVLVMAVQGVYLEGLGSNSWLKIYDLQQSAYSGAQAAVKDANDNVIGWEGCYTVNADCYTSVELHANKLPGDTTSTGKGGQSEAIALDLTCGCSTDSDCSSTDGCVISSCSNNKCVNTQIEGCECDIDEDCTASECFTASCAKPDLSAPALWKCLVVSDPNAPSCGTPSACAGPSDCFSNYPDESQVCADATCDAVTGCEFTSKLNAEGNNCDNTYTPTDQCDLGYKCNGKDCLQEFQKEGNSCGTYTVPLGGSSQCYTGVCRAVNGGKPGETKCTAETLPDVSTLCGERPRGLCDKGDWCVAGVCESNHFEGSDKLCRASAGCCDAPDYCSGDSFYCGDDAKLGSETVCRAPCEKCLADPAEVCDGVNDSCPQNDILADELCLYAGQSNPAGSVSLTAKPSVADSSLYEFCPVISLVGWNLVSGGEPIKAEFSTVERPGSAPGKYSYKYPNGGIKASQTEEGVFELTQCLTFSTSQLCEESPQLYFAIHLDVTNGQNAETAWALECPNDATAHSGLPFTNKKGNANQGWGKYFVWTPCCPTDPNCEKCSVVPVEPPATPSPTPVPTSSSPTPAPVANPWICAREFEPEGELLDIACDQALVCPTRRRLGGLFA